MSYTPDNPINKSTNDDALLVCLLVLAPVRNDESSVTVDTLDVESSVGRSGRMDKAPILAPLE